MAFRVMVRAFALLPLLMAVLTGCGGEGPAMLSRNLQDAMTELRARTIHFD